MSDYDEHKPAVMTYTCANPHCEAELTEFNAALCDACGKPYCSDCVLDFLKVCANCGAEGCTGCMQYRSEGGEYFCGDTCEEEYKNK